MLPRFNRSLDDHLPAAAVESKPDGAVMRPAILGNSILTIYLAASAVCTASPAPTHALPSFMRGDFYYAAFAPEASSQVILALSTIVYCEPTSDRPDKAFRSNVVVESKSTASREPIGVPGSIYDPSECMRKKLESVKHEPQRRNRDREFSSYRTATPTADVLAPGLD